MSDRVQVPWLAGYPVDIPGQGVIEPGSLAWISEHEAAASEHWGAPVALEDLPKEDLKGIAAEQGIETAGKTKARLASEIKDS